LTRSAASAEGHVGDWAGYWAYADRLSECSEFISSMGCGSYEYTRMKASPADFTPNQFARAVAEWVDGDAISAHQLMKSKRLSISTCSSASFFVDYLDDSDEDISVFQFNEQPYRNIRSLCGRRSAQHCADDCRQL
jgi:hypothetical protein